MDMFSLLDTFLKNAAQGRDLLLAGALFIIPLSKRKRFWIRAAVGSLCCLIFSYLIPHSQFSYFLDLLAAVLAIWLCCDITLADSIYCAVCCYACQHVAYAVYTIFGRLFPSPSPLWERPPGLSLTYCIVYLPVFLLLYLFFGRKLGAAGRYDVDLGQTLVSSIGTLTVVWLLSSIVQNNTDDATIIIVCQLYGIFCCVSMLWGQVNQRSRSYLERELLLQQQLTRQQEEQYKISRETIDMINQKCHDLKYQLAALRIIPSEEQREASLSEFERSIQIYDSTLKTGNHVLDTVLTGKSLYCEANHITMTCMADGEKLSFLDPVDVYTIFGNAVDNAIESVVTLDDPEKRLIAVSVWSKSGLLLIQFENYFKGTLEFEDGLPLTQKADPASHGFGMRSIRYALEKYKGHMALSTDNQIFMLSISIPLPLENESS